MAKIAFVFPGQGAQCVGMGLDVYTTNLASKDIFDRGDKKLGFPLTSIIFQGPEETLKQTFHTQPALLLTSLALLAAFQATGLQADFLVGHSLGEYTALVAAGVISIEDAVQTVRSRGLFMDQAVPTGQGAMAAVLGADREALAELCSRISNEVGIVEMANINCPGQIVVSGSREGIQAVVEQGTGIGAKRVIPLVVSGPFHSSLMKPASVQLAEVLAKIVMKDASIPVIANVTAKPVQDPEVIRTLLVEQVYSPVFWEDSIQWLLAQGVDTFIEIGPGSVLGGLIRKVNKSVKVIQINNQESIDKYMAEFQ